MYTSREGCWIDGQVLPHRDVVFFRGGTQPHWKMLSQANRIEVQFRSSNGDQLWNGMKMMFDHMGPPLPL